MRLSAGFVSSCLRSVTSLLLAGTVSLALTGCSPVKQAGAAAVAAATSSPTGMVHGGQSPVSGSSVSILTSSGTVVGGPYTTNSGGGFTFSTLSCSAGDSLYIEATGGNPGLSAGTNNTAIDMVAQIGTCASVTSGNNFFVVNELTTVASVEYGTSATGYVNPYTGAVSTTNGTTLNMLANILAGCVNSSGATGASDPCGKLFALTIGGVSGSSRVSSFSRAHAYAGSNAHSILAAMLAIAANPSTNIPQLFALTAGSSPFQPQLAAAPPTLTPDPAPPVTPTQPSQPTQPTAPTVTLPTATVSGGTMTFTGGTTGAKFYYTTNGATPSTGSFNYATTGPFSVSSTDSVTILGVLSGYQNNVQQVITPDTPGVALSGTHATLTGATDATIYYTVDNLGPPTLASAHVNSGGNVNVGAADIIVAAEKRPGMFLGGTAGGGRTCSISVSLSGLNTLSVQQNQDGFCIPGTEYYLTNGSVPTTASPTTSGSIAITANETIIVVAKAPGAVYSNGATYNTGAALATLDSNCGITVNALAVDRQGNVYAVCAQDTTSVNVYKYTSTGSRSTLWSFGLSNANTRLLQIALTGSGMLYVPSPDGGPNNGTTPGLYRYTAAAGKTFVLTGIASPIVTSIEEGAYVPTSGGVIAIDADETDATSEPVQGTGTGSCSVGLWADIYPNGFSNFFCTQPTSLSYINPYSGQSYHIWNPNGGTATAFSQSVEGNDYLAVKSSGGTGSYLYDISASNASSLNYSLTTLMGTGSPVSAPDGRLVSQASVNDPTAIAVDMTGTLYFGEADGKIRKVAYNTAISGKVGAPTITTVGNSYKLSSTTGGTLILYTLDGSIPTWQDYIIGNGLDGRGSDSTMAVPTGGTISTSTVGHATITAVTTAETDGNETAGYYDSDVVTFTPSPN